ncbi:tetratricopeptide repeat protein [Myxococcus sp. K38C18041901]|uniref:tetratricopeptide repeat protein n=1 Tax=Myxococcus guangdongensis TaxID=2906760 RepID=UPI0020A81E3B|nr:tetratricopeptide repeat protein [Myxococcus guangdongensis]MCP3061898.1 tetratricopeptide repeat protein [Myxococcus guangdongensis]
MDSADSRSFRLTPRTQVLLVALTAALVYAGTLSNGFVYDDVQLVVDNPWLRSWSELSNAFQRPLFPVEDGAINDSARGPAASYFRPLAHVLFFAQRAVFGLEAWGFHLVLLLMHAAVCALVLWLLRACLKVKEPGASPAAEWGALAGALLFAVHPVHTESVAWLSGCMDVAATLLVLLAVRLMVAGPSSWGRGVGAGLLWAAGLLFKEVAVVFPAVLWATDRATGEGVSPPGLKGWVRRYAPLGVGALGYAALRLNAVGLSVPLQGGEGSGGLYPLHLLALVGKLGGKLFWPHPLVVTIPSQVSPLVSEVVLGSVLLLLLAGALWRSWRASPAVLAGGVWLLTPLLPIFLMQLRGVEAYAERFLYLPSVGFCLLMAVGAKWVLERWPGQSRALGLAAGGVVVVFAALTLARVPAWRDDISLWEDTLSKTPEEPSIHAYLGASYLKARRVEEAIAPLQVAVAAMPQLYQPQSDLAVAYALMGRMDLAVPQLERVHAMRPREPVVLHNLGLALRKSGRLEEAVERFRAVLRLAPRRADSHLELGRTLLQLGRPAEAVVSLEEALRLRPDSAPARDGLRQARLAVGATP